MKMACQPELDCSTVAIGAVSAGIVPPHDMSVLFPSRHGQP